MEVPRLDLSHAGGGALSEGEHGLTGRTLSLGAGAVDKNIPYRPTFPHPPRNALPRATSDARTSCAA